MTESWRPVILAVARRPGLWSTALRQVLRVAPPGWWRHWPPSPMPPASYVAFRLQTAYGAAECAPDPLDLVAYLEWCRRIQGTAG